MNKPLQLSSSILASIGCLGLAAQAAFAQGCNLAGSPSKTLRSPLIYEAPSTPPGVKAPDGPRVAPGDGRTPNPVVGGHTGAPTLLPYIPRTPVSNTGCGNQYTVPFDPSATHMPGQFGADTYAPPPPSTPGADPGYLPGPRDFYAPPVSVTNINPQGGISGSAPTQRWGGQTTTDFGRYKYQGTRTNDFGQGQYMGSTSQDGPSQTRSGAVATQDLYGNRSPRGGSGIMTYAPY